MSSKLLILLSIFMFATTACADSPDSPVLTKDGGAAPDGGDNSAADGDDDEAPIKAMALKYKGAGPLGAKCDIYLALEEEHEEEAEEDGHDHDDDHGHAEHFLIKVDYTTPDGHKAKASEGQFFQVDNGNFVDVDPEIPGAAINFNSANFFDSNVEKLESVQHLNEMIKTNGVEQLFRIEYSNGLDFHEYEEALEAVLEDEAKFAVNKNILNNMKSATLALLHNDHYHTPVCNFDGSGLGAVEMVETEFDLEGHDDDHDHD